MAANVTSVTVDFDTKGFVRSTEKTMDGAAAEMAIDILTRAQMNAPKASGALVRSGRVTKGATGQWYVSFGDNFVQYALRREHENQKNPQTLHYLERAGESVKKGNITKYFR